MIMATWVINELEVHAPSVCWLAGSPQHLPVTPASLALTPDGHFRSIDYISPQPAFQ